MLDEHLAGLLRFPESVLHKDPVWAVGGDYASGSMVWPCVSHPLCHLNRRRVAWWLSSRNIWMMLRCLRVWQRLALLTVSSLIHLVQRVCVLEIGRHFNLPFPLPSACLASVSLRAPMTCLMYNHFHIVKWIYFCTCRYCRALLPAYRHVVSVSYLYLNTRTVGKAMHSVRITAPLSYYPCFTFSSPYFHWEEHWPHLWGQ